MKYGSLIIEPIIGLLASLQLVARYILIPYIKNKEGTPTKYSKVKIILSLFCFISVVSCVYDFKRLCLELRLPHKKKEKS